MSSTYHATEATFFLLEIVYFKTNNYEPIDKMQQFQLKF